MVWQAVPPFRVLGVSKHPVLMANETASGWTEKENWDGDGEKGGLVMEKGGKGHGVRDLGSINNTSSSTANSSSSSTMISQQQPFNGKPYWAYFTYTVSIAYAWGRTGVGGVPVREEVGEKNVGYWDDEVVLGIGIDDRGQGFARARAGELVGCLRGCGERGE